MYITYTYIYTSRRMPARDKQREKKFQLPLDLEKNKKKYFFSFFSVVLATTPVHVGERAAFDALRVEMMQNMPVNPNSNPNSREIANLRSRLAEVEKQIAGRATEDKYAPLEMMQELSVHLKQCQERLEKVEGSMRGTKRPAEGGKTIAGYASLAASQQDALRKSQGGKTIAGYVAQMVQNNDDESDSETESDSEESESESESESEDIEVRKSYGGKCPRSWPPSNQEEEEEEAAEDGSEERQSPYEDAIDLVFGMPPQKRTCRSAAESPKNEIMFDDDIRDLFNIDAEAPSNSVSSPELFIQLDEEAQAAPAADSADKQALDKFKEDYDDDSMVLRMAKKLYERGMPVAAAPPTGAVVAQIYVPHEKSASLAQLRRLMAANGVNVNHLSSSKKRQGPQYDDKKRIVIVDRYESDNSHHIGSALVERVSVDLMLKGHPIMTLHSFVSELAEFNATHPVYNSVFHVDMCADFYNFVVAKKTALLMWPESTPIKACMFPVSYLATSEEDGRQEMQQVCDFLEYNGMSLVDRQPKGKKAARTIDELFELIREKFVPVK
jgi:hypothetical protein